MSNTATIDLGGIPLRVESEHEVVPGYFNRFDRTNAEPLAAVRVRAWQRDGIYRWDSEGEAQREATVLPNVCSDALLPYGRCVFHGAAMRWRGRAILFTAPSGTGKSTQCRLWQRLWPEERKMLNGDKPVLELRSDSVWVHPSPWRGKENVGCYEGAPLGAIVCLRQAKENTVTRLTPGEAALPVFSQMLLTHPDEETTQRAAAFADRLVRSVPVLMLRNLGDETSARMTREALSEVFHDVPNA